MTVSEVVNGTEFNLSIVSKEVFGNSRIISDKKKNNRNKKWLPGDFERIAKYFEEKYKINLEVT